MEAVVEALHFPAGSTGHDRATGMLTHRGESIPFIRLRERLSHDAGRAERENVVVVRYARGRAGLVVDELHGECHTVVKPLPKSLRGIPGLSGSAILPNGRIAFIVDVPGLLQVEIDQRSSLSRNPIRSTQEWSCSAN
ncbi:MAG: two-component system, chemotaxis family, sensor kinase CheA, partial [Acidobacteriota bacterium]|jgi:two-component system chemotaxis sensor kinase CheA|nr:two-component system, chemotaxis family, sensor kinase CheA [Acidobacteriota bacterium]